MRTTRPFLGLLLCFLALAPIRAEEAPTAAPAFAAVPPGVEYLHQRIGDVPWSIHVVKISRAVAEFRFACTLGGGATLGLKPLTQQVAGWPADQGVPIAAVNADFYNMTGPYRGDPSGLHITRGELVSVGEGAFWLDRDGRPQMGPVTPRLKVTWPEGTETPLALNAPRKEDAAVLYTPSLGASTHTTGGRELVLERDGEGHWLPVKPGQTLSARVREVRTEGDTPLSPDAMVLSLGPKLAEGTPEVAAGTVLQLSIATDPDLTGVELAIGGHPVLLRGGKETDWGAGPQPRHPRTALGWNDTHYFLIAVDGRQKGLSAGMTFPELADLARRLGCTDALNLDGGGSTTLWLGGKVMNSPSDRRERPVANALLVIRKPQ